MFEPDPVVNAREQARLARRLRNLNVPFPDELAVLGGLRGTNGRALVQALESGELDITSHRRGALLEDLPCQITSCPDGFFVPFAREGAFEVVVNGRILRSASEAVEGMTRIPNAEGPKPLDPGMIEVVHLIERRFPGEVEALMQVVRRDAGNPQTDLDVVTRHALFMLASGERHLGKSIVAARTAIIGTCFERRAVIGVADGTVASRLFRPGYRDPHERSVTNRPDQLLEWIGRLRAGETLSGT